MLLCNPLYAPQTSKRCALLSLSPGSADLSPDSKHSTERYQKTLYFGPQFKHAELGEDKTLYVGKGMDHLADANSLDYTKYMYLNMVKHADQGALKTRYIPHADHHRTDPTTNTLYAPREAIHINDIGPAKTTFYNPKWSEHVVTPALRATMIIPKGSKHVAYGPNATYYRSPQSVP